MFDYNISVTNSLYVTVSYTVSVPFYSGSRLLVTLLACLYWDCFLVQYYENIETFQLLIIFGQLFKNFRLLRNFPGQSGIAPQVNIPQPLSTTFSSITLFLSGSVFFLYLIQYNWCSLPFNCTPVRSVSLQYKLSLGTLRHPLSSQQAE